MTVSIPVSTCPSCGAVANPRWVECLACDAPLSGPSRPKASEGNSPTSKGGADPKLRGNPAHRNSLPQDWTAATTHLLQLDCPTTESGERWQQVRSDAGRLLDWVPLLMAAGWTTQGTFGRDDLDRQSLAWKVRGQRIESIGKVAAVLRGADASTSYVYRRDSDADGLVSADGSSPESKSTYSRNV